jgi:hypothetical protein
MRPRRVHATISFSFFVIITLTLISPVYADQLTVSTNKPSYNLGATINVVGRLTLGGEPVADGLVAVQVNDYQGNLKFIRVVTTGTTPAPWKVGVLKFESCNAQGNPSSSFARGSLAYFKVTVESLDSAFENEVVVALDLFDSVGFSVAVTNQSFSIGPKKQFELFMSMPIPREAFLGDGVCCLSVLTRLPREERNTDPYCPEENVGLTITNPGSEPANVSSALFSSGSGGLYNLSFKLPNNAALGSYSVYVGALWNAYAKVSFDYFWLYSDVTRDGAVNILDISIAGKAFGSRIGEERYRKLADTNSDGIINIIDISVIAKDFGKVMKTT